MTLIVREFQTCGLRERRWTYFEANQYLQEDFKEFRQTVKTVGQALERMWYENDRLMRLSEIECFMIYMVMLKICVSQDYPCEDLRAELKRMISTGMLEKYKKLLPADEYQLLVDDVKALRLDS